MNRGLLIIMARYPAYGKVKTRLAREIGKRRALDVYRLLLEHHIKEFYATNFDVEWWYTPGRARFAQWLHGVPPHPSPLPLGERVRVRGAVEWRCHPQPSGDLGQRMQRIFADAFARGYGRVVMIGTDAPAMQRSTVRQALRALTLNAAVFQPTEDGGYALIGLREMLPVFEGIDWSTSAVMRQTRQRLRRRRVAFAELPVTYDVDTAADLTRMTLSRWRKPLMISS